MHAAAIATLPRARLVAVTDVAGGAAAAFAAARGCAAEPGLDQLLARPDVDVVCVCVPSGLHAEVGTRAAKAGKHLVVEKPIDVTLAAADRLIEAAHAAGVALTVISQHRFDPGLIELKRLLGDGALGRLVLAEASTKWYRTQAYYDSAEWRGTWAMDGGSLMNQGIHYVDLLRWCMGPVTEVTAVCATQAHQVEVEDTALATLEQGLSGWAVTDCAKTNAGDSVCRLQGMRTSDGCSTLFTTLRRGALLVSFSRTDRCPRTSLVRVKSARESLRLTLWTA